MCIRNMFYNMCIRNMSTICTCGCDANGACHTCAKNRGGCVHCTHVPKHSRTQPKATKSGAGEINVRQSAQEGNRPKRNAIPLVGDTAMFLSACTF